MKFVVSIMLAVGWVPQGVSPDVVALAEMVPDEIPDKPTLFLQDEPPQVQYVVSSYLVAQNRRVRDAVLTIVASGDPVRNARNDGPDGILNALGPKLCSQLVPVFLNWVKSGTDRRRMLASFALRQLDRFPDSEIPDLRKLLMHQSAGTRQLAADLLGSCGKRAHSALPELREVLDDADPLVQSAACAAMLNIESGSPEPLPVLLSLISGDDARRAADSLELLVKCRGWMQHEDQVRGALDRFQMRAEVARVARGAPPETVALLARWLLNRKSTRSFRLEILRSFRNRDCDASAAQAAVIRMIREFDSEYRGDAIRTLAHTGQFDAREIRPVRGDGLTVLDAVATAMGSCSKQSAPVARKVLLEILNTLKRPAAGSASNRPRVVARRISAAACKSLCELGDAPEEAAIFVRRMLETGSASEQVKAMDLVPLFGDDNVGQLIPALMTAMGEGKVFRAPFDLHRIDSTSLASIGKPAIPALLVGLKHDSKEIRRVSASVLGQIGDPVAVEPLFELLRAEQLEFDNSEVVLRAVTFAIADTIQAYEGREARIDWLTGLLKFEWARGGVIRALGNIGPSAQRVVPLLLKLEGINAGSATGFELARALTKLRANGSLGLLGIRRVLREVSEQRSFSPNQHSGLRHTIDLIVELGSDRAKPLIPELAFMVEQHEFLHREYRMHAAYALARLEPNNLKWRAHLERWAALDIPLNPGSARLWQLMQAAE